MCSAQEMSVEMLNNREIKCDDIRACKSLINKVNDLDQKFEQNKHAT